VCPKIAVEAAADTHVGRRRVNNEDSFGVVPEMGLFMVADGLGGKAAGEVASRMAIEVIRACFEEDDPEDTWPYGWGRGTDREEARLVWSIQCANRSILEAGRANAETRGMATTFAGVLVSSGRARIVHVGDSRVYRYRQGALERLTTDHTLLEEMLQKGGVSLDEIASVPDMANAVTRALGCDRAVEVETRVERTETGDVFLICSDGLWGPVPERDMAVILAWSSRLETKVAGLIWRALELGGPDNVTCVLARVTDTPSCR
jgi:PPM family protein phosphatase